MSNIGSLEEVDMEISEGSDMELSDVGELPTVQHGVRSARTWETASGIVPSRDRAQTTTKDKPTEQHSGRHMQVEQVSASTVIDSSGKLFLDTHADNMENAEGSDTESVSSYETARTSFSEDEPGLVTQDDERKREALLKELEAYETRILEFEDRVRKRETRKQELSKKAAEIKLEILNLQVRMSIRQRENQKRKDTLKAARKEARITKKKKKATAGLKKRGTTGLSQKIVPGTKGYDAIENLLREGYLASLAPPKSTDITSPTPPTPSKPTPQSSQDSPVQLKTVPAAVDLPTIPKRDKGKGRMTIPTTKQVPNGKPTVPTATATPMQTTFPVASAQTPKSDDTSNGHTTQKMSKAADDNSGTDIIIDVTPVQTSEKVSIPPIPQSAPTPAPQKAAFKAFKSPLESLASKSRDTVSKTKNAKRQMCKYETQGGTCNDDTCTALHFRDLQGLEKSH